MPKPIDESQRAAWSRGTWLFLLACVGVIAPASLFVHDFMLETLKVPYPKTVGLPISVKFLGDLVRMAALAVLCRVARPSLRGGSRLVEALSIGVLLVMLHETIRVFLIESTIVGSSMYTACDIAPRALSWFVCGVAVAWISLGDQKPRTVALAIIALVAVEVFALHPALDAVGASLMQGLSEPVIRYTDPYPFKVNLLIYVTFIEPTIAAFVIAAYCWPHLGTGSLRRIMAFTALLLLVRGRFIALLVESFWVDQPRMTAFLAVGQFFLETLVLGLLVALAWNYASSRLLR